MSKVICNSSWERRWSKLVSIVSNKPFNLTSTKPVQTIFTGCPHDSQHSNISLFRIENYVLHSSTEYDKTAIFVPTQDLYHIQFCVVTMTLWFCLLCRHHKRQENPLYFNSSHTVLKYVNYSSAHNANAYCRQKYNVAQIFSTTYRYNTHHNNKFS